MKTHEELDNIIREHLTTQRERATDDRGTCKYRTGELKCAVGCLIPDELYDETIEGAGISWLRVTGDKWDYQGNQRDDKLVDILEAVGVPASYTDRLYKWQTRHDLEENWDHTGYIGPLD